MANLYDGQMAAIYDAMYQTFVNYDEEYTFYNNLIQEYKASTTLEIGSGTGNLAKRFNANNQNYQGLDYSNDMIAIAKERNKNSSFIQGDMRDFKLDKPVDSILITGRSTSYLITNDDMNRTFDSIYKNLNENGILIFDFIDANRFIPFTKENPIIIHEAEFENINYKRESHWDTNNALENFMLEWTAQYYTVINGEKEVIENDFSTVRVFTLNEMQLFLYLNNFEILKTIDRKTYAYDTYVIVAQKKS
ncbi:class I SAM-dependent DNA methyltransferase [Flavobacterium sp. UBA7680]|uniref:class I SAM-dependent DNA methyltransferase n=1 Tax=Flavobacterium sp. UBA7680 TaxID=1946559 RepID=UPI0025C2FD10|nr:class I SAM-dependent methyltransferase [Flavobacterium sp. UBA7680]